ncbi:MAG: hypothetical protein GTO55_02505, partial [Armatimonadetes bacterium]|nr:hypothetical protein [Armatimonadota bacterium]NIM23151.1 hypothetical protein [Armatimonadota bacterium]NIM67019.1 hypothetical protein [Armatimonadota bacterium]NIN05208.1 hypothetical protein [Armatimonadota bacterium]NIO96280.1 hypothetical protein [Armatimonadota bacterium]
MAYLPDSNRVQRRPQQPGTWAAGLVLCWTIIMTPVGVFHLYLARRLDAISPGAALVAPIGFVCVAIFAALAVNSESNLISQNGSAKARRLAYRLRKSDNQYLQLALAALVVPLAFSLLGAVITWTRLTVATSGTALFVISASMALSSGFCWVFSHFLLKELIGRKERTHEGGLYAAFQVARSVKSRSEYAPPVYPPLVILAMLSLFVFAFTIPSTLGAMDRSENWDTPALAAVIFVITLLALLALGRFNSLLSLAKRSRMNLPGLGKRDGSAEFGWAAVIGILILLICFLSALLPLNALVDFFQRFRVQPPQTRLELRSYSSAEGLGGSIIQWLLSGVGGWLLTFIILALLVTAAWLVCRRIKRTRTWERFVVWAARLWNKLKTWVKRIIYGVARPSELSRSLAGHKTKRDHLVDIFDDPEALKQLSAAQVIMATFHLLLECAGKRGWLKKAHQPPFEALRTLLAA